MTYSHSQYFEDQSIASVLADVARAHRILEIENQGVRVQGQGFFEHAALAAGNEV